MEKAILLDNSRLFNRYGVSVFKKTTDRFWKLHWHDCWELEVVTGGSGHQILNGVPYDLKAGSAYLLSPTDFHEVTANDLSVYNICFCDEQLPDSIIHAFSGGKGGFFVDCGGDDYYRLTQICEMLYRECQIPDQNFGTVAVEHLLGLLFVQLLRLFDVNGNHEIGGKIPLVSRAVSFIHLHFRDDPSLSDVAEKLCVTPNYLSERFHAVTGKRYKEYVTEIKLQYARKLLDTGGISVTEACFASGFSSLSNFLRVFKLRYGYPPGQLQRAPH